MSLISKEKLLTHLQRAEMASDVTLPIEFFRDLVYQAMPLAWVGLMRGVRVEGETVVITVNKGNDAARELCGALIEEMKT
jgi:hypothetical protein